MSTSWEDAEADAAYDYFQEQIEKELTGRHIETVGEYISDGYTQSEDVISEMAEELGRLDPAQHRRSIGFLSCALLETIEREAICLPLLVSGLGLDVSSTSGLVERRLA